MEPWVVPLSDVDVSDDLAEAVGEAVKSGWWSMGPRVAELEREFASLCETAHALAVANGTVALHAALVACGCGPGDEVVLPSLNFVAAANVVVHTGAMPVFCDIVGEDDLNLDPRDLEAALSPATKAVIALHYGGHPCAMGEVLALAVGPRRCGRGGRGPRAGCDSRGPSVRLHGSRRLLQPLLEQEPADR